MSNLTPWRRPLSRWDALFGRDPFSNIDRTFNNLVENFLDSPTTRAMAERGTQAMSFVPAVDLRDGDTELCLTAELPGLDEKDIHLTVNADSVTLQGEKRYEKRGGDKDKHYIERSYGSFLRTVPLPCEVDREKVEATFKKGVLEVHMPKSTAAKNQARQIQIKT